MVEAAAVGIEPRHFWQYTPRETFAIFQGAAKQRVRDRQMALWSAWHSAAFERQKRLPDLAGMLQKLEPPKVMSNHELRTQVMGLAQAFGAKVTYRKRE